MSIVKMKRLRLFAMQSDREELLKLLQRMGCVEIGRPDVDLTDPQWAGLSAPDSAALNRAREEGASLNGALDTLKRHVPVKGGLFKARPVVSEQEFFHDGAYEAALGVADTVNHAQRRIQSLNAERSKVLSQKAALAPWLELDAALDTPSTKEVTVQFGTVPNRIGTETVINALADAAPLSQLIPAGADNESQYVLVLCHNSDAQNAEQVLRENGFSQLTLKGWHGTAAENDRALDAELIRIDGALEEAAETIRSCGDRRGELERCADRAAQEIRRQEAKSLLVDTDGAFYLDGWIPAASVAELAGTLEPFTCAWETTEPSEEDYPEVPVQLKNNWLTRPLNMVTEMYSLPAYDGLDPNPLMAPFFILFYGIMMADMGYGLLMMLASVIVVRKANPKGTMGHLFRLAGLCGITTFLFGAITGGFFGDFLPQIAKLINPDTTFTALPALFTPVNDTLMILIGSLALGVVQIFTGMAISLIRKLKRHDYASAIKDEIAWYLVFACIGAAVLTGAVKPFLIAIVVILLGTQWIGGKGIVGKLTAIGGSLYNNLTGYFSDILSYSRLMALMLSGAVVAQVFNTLGAIPGNVVFFVIISMVGNMLNMALNLLGCYVHDLRLQCLEYFNRFYQDGGRAFRPLDINTKYVDISEK